MFRAAVQRCVQRRSLHQSLGLRMSRTGPLLGDNGFEHRRYEVNRLFAIAMDEVEAARESIGTTYFPEDEIMAREAVETRQKTTIAAAYPR
ncbi:hypothetical protein DIPPA_29475 [Diplonema papillatum]|nr:hypothetical protein DIPPA_29475 [Diplonema papillatum]